MRPRINTFGRITYTELNQYLNENRVYGFTVQRLENTIVYSYYIMFRNTRKAPDMLYVEVSKASKLVMKAWLENGREFKTIDELKKYIG